MSFIKDTFFGGAEKKAAKVQQAGLEQGQADIRAGQAQARQDVLKLFPAAQENIGLGFQGALDVFGQSLPAQTDVFQQGNVGAQQALINALPQFQNAILGGQVDFSAFQPTQIQAPDLGFFQQQLPQFTDPFAPPPQQQVTTIPTQGGNINPSEGLFPVNPGAGQPFNPLGGFQGGSGSQFGGGFQPGTGSPFGGGLLGGQTPNTDTFGNGFFDTNSSFNNFGGF